MTVSDQVTEVGVKYLAEVCAEKVPAGYKQTEVGVIPEDWDCLLAIEVINILAGYSFSSKVSVTSGIRWLKIANVGVNEIKWDTESFLPDNYIEVFKDYLLKENDIVLALTRPILGDNLKVARLSVHDAPALLNQRVARLTSKGSSQNFIHYLVQHSSFIAAMNLAMAGSDPPNIGTKALGNVLVAVPAHEPEQIAIANALSDIDALINELEKLITKKQAIKTATMQQLLTGSTRLPQFALREDGTKKGYKQTELGMIPDDWVTPTVKELSKNIIDYRGRTPKKLGMEWGGNISALSAGNVKKGFIDFDLECYFGSQELYSRWMTSGDPKQGDIVFTMEAPLGNAALIPDDRKYILSQRVVLLQINEEKFESKLIIQILLSRAFQLYLYDCATGSTAQGIKRTTFESLHIPLPNDIYEQTAIATILSDMDTEIQTLQQRLSKTRQIKQGMMQELLTGKTRLIQRKLGR